jgi:hypothetical protein
MDMKQAGKIMVKQLILTAKAGILALGLSAMLFIPAMTMPVYSLGHDHYYFGIAYLAEKEARSKEKISETEDKTIIATAEVSAKEKQEKSSYDHERNISLHKEMRTDREW